MLHKNPTIVPTEPPPPPPQEKRFQEVFREQVARRRAHARDRRRTWLVLGGAGALVLFLVILGLSALFRSESPAQEAASFAEQATLLITSTPSGAMVYLDDTERGATPFVSDTLTPGKRTLSVRMASFVPFDSVLFLADTVSLDLLLEAEPVAAGVTEEPPTPAPQTATREEEEPEPVVSKEPTSVAPEATPPPEEVADETPAEEEVTDATPVQEDVADETPVEEAEQGHPQTEEPVQPEGSDAAPPEEDETTNEDSPVPQEAPAEQPPPQQETPAVPPYAPIVIEGQPATTPIEIPKRPRRLGQGTPAHILDVVGKRTLAVGEVENFRVKTAPESTPPTEFYWASEQGVFALGRSINLHFTKAGVYTIKVEAYNGYGTDNATLKITVKEPTNN